MWPILSAITRGFDVILAPFARMHPAVGLLVISIVTGIVMLLIFGKTSNQKRITETKDKLKAYIMEMWIFRDSTRVMFGALGNVIRHNLQYLRHSLRPLVFILIPVLLIMVQLGIRYGSEPLMPGESTILTVKLDGDVAPTDTELELEAPFAVRITSPPLRVDSMNEISWRIQGLSPGTHELTLRAPGERLTKTVVVAGLPGTPKVGGLRALAGTWSAFLYPSEPPIPRDSIVRGIELGYRTREIPLLGIGLHWILIFFVVSVAAGFALKGVFGIDV
jgi:uncharacterized membrane protein (DUF106 family)